MTTPPPPPPPDRHEASRPAFEALMEANRESTARDTMGSYSAVITSLKWQYWCCGIDWQASQQALPTSEAYGVESCRHGTSFRYDCPQCENEDKELPPLDEPQPDWRPLEPGEIIQDGDEYMGDRSKNPSFTPIYWEEIKGSAGTPAHSPSTSTLIFRTRRPKPTPVSVTLSIGGVCPPGKSNSKPEPQSAVELVRDHITYPVSVPALPEFDRCETCNAELGPFGQQGTDGEPTLDCIVCILREKLASAQAERDQATAGNEALQGKLLLAQSEASLFKRSWESDDKLILACIRERDAAMSERDAAQAEAREYREALYIVRSDIEAVGDEWLSNQQDGIRGIVANIRKHARAALAKYQPTTTPE